MIITQCDFSEEDLRNNKDKDFIKHVEQHYHGDYHIDTEIINKKRQTLLRVFVIRGKY